MAAEEAKDPVKSLPRGLIGCSMLILAAFALLILFLSAGAMGAEQVKTQSNSAA